VKRSLAMPVTVREGGRKRKKSTQEGFLMVLREKALHADAPALKQFLELALRFNNDAPEIGPSQALEVDDQAILDDYVAERIAARTDIPAAKSSIGTAPEAGAGAARKTRK